MPSSFSWLDFAEHDRRRALEVIELFRERDTVDELGIGIIRDAFADLLLPGTSVIQTRARYFFFIPWIYLRLEQRKVPSEKIAGEARKAEIALVHTLLASSDIQGVIGRLAKSDLKILPSAIYWQALLRLGIRTFPGTREQYHRSVDRFYAGVNRGVFTDDGDRADHRRSHNWNPNIPDAPKDFPATAELALRRREAEFLRERIIFSARTTLYRYLVEDEQAAATDATFLWDYEGVDRLPKTIQEQIAHARNFSEVMHGAPLLYNLMLAELTEREDQAAAYVERIAEWRDGCQARAAELARWDRRRFWEIVATTGARVTPATRAFIDQWLELARANDARRLRASEAARRLIQEREQQLKRGQSRLYNQRARELWNGDAGTRPLTYRWEIAMTMVRDIHQGLAAQATNA